MAKIRKPSKSDQDRHLPGDPKNGQNATFQEFKKRTPRSEAAPPTNNITHQNTKNKNNKKMVKTKVLKK